MGHNISINFVTMKGKIMELSIEIEWWSNELEALPFYLGVEKTTKIYRYVKAYVKIGAQDLNERDVYEWFCSQERSGFEKTYQEALTDASAFVLGEKFAEHLVEESGGKVVLKKRKPSYIPVASRATTMRTFKLGRGKIE